MLLQHAWLAPLVKPETITEEDEDADPDPDAEAEANSAEQPRSSSLTSAGTEAVVDKEVADWVKECLEKRKNGTLGKGAKKPALHAAPLDVVPSPGQNGQNGPVAMDFAVPA